MSTKRRAVALLDRRLARRLIIAPITTLLALLGGLLSPLLVGAAGLRDALTNRPKLPTVRLTILLIGALIIETIGMLVSAATWLLTGFGYLGTARWRWHMHRSYMGWYTRSMLALITRVIGTSVQWRDSADLSAGPVVLIARHTSFFDALIPATLLCRRNQLLAHHIVTHGLKYAPCIDIVGHRFPNRFIKRTPGEGSSELAHIEAVGSCLDHQSAAIIFPEGTFRSPDRFERAVRRIRRRQPALAQRAETLAHVLPPRANGTHALLKGAPDADVVICVNTGFESFSTIKEIVEQPFSDQPIIVETWRIDRSEVPTDPDEFALWLFEQYVLIDTWVENTKQKAT